MRRQIGRTRSVFARRHQHLRLVAAALLGKGGWILFNLAADLAPPPPFFGSSNRLLSTFLLRLVAYDSGLVRRRARLGDRAAARNIWDRRRSPRRQASRMRSAPLDAATRAAVLQRHIRPT